MPGRVRVSDLQSLSTIRAACIRFGEEAPAALQSGGSDASRTLAWLQREKLPYWKRQIRVRSEEAVRANTKFIQQSSGPSPRPSVDARVEYELAKRRVREAEEKHESTRHWIRTLEREIERYRASIQPMAAIARSLSNEAVAHLDSLLAALEAYTNEQAARPNDNSLLPTDDQESNDGQPGDAS